MPQPATIAAACLPSFAGTAVETTRNSNRVALSTQQERVGRA